MMYCQNCGSELPENAIFCNKCGAPQTCSSGQDLKWSTERETHCKNQKVSAKRKMPKVFKIFAGIFCGIAVLVLLVYGMWWNEKIRIPEKAWKEAEERYESGDYYAAYLQFWKAPYSYAEYHKAYDWHERQLASLLRYCNTLKEGDDFLDFHGQEWHVLQKFEETDRMLLGLNQPTYEEENGDPTRPSYYGFLTWEHWEEALIAVDRETVFGMSDELATETFGKTAAEAAKTVYEDEWKSRPDVQWFYPMLMLDLSFPKEDPFWDSVMYGARLNIDTHEFIYGPLKMSISMQTDIPQIRYLKLEEDYTEMTREEAIAEFEAAGGIDVAVNYLEAELQEDGKTMVETLLADYDLSDGSIQGTCRFRCWDIHDPQSILDIWWVVDDSDSYQTVTKIMDTMELADKPATEFEGYSYLGYRTHVRGGAAGDDNPISHTYDKMLMSGSRY